jgi:hypothetical protein
LASGSHVLIDLVKNFPKVRFVCLDKLNYCGTVRNFDEIKAAANFEFVKVCEQHAPMAFVLSRSPQGDITSTDLVNHLIKAHHVDTILNFAAQTHVGESSAFALSCTLLNALADNSFGNALEFTRSNVLGTHVLLESAKLFKHQVRADSSQPLDLPLDTSAGSALHSRKHGRSLRRSFGGDIVLTQPSAGVNGVSLVAERSPLHHGKRAQPHQPLRSHQSRC